MNDTKLADYIKSTLAAGFAEDQIKIELERVGWKSEEIASGFHEAKKTGDKGGISKTFKIIFIILAAGLLIVLGYLIVDRYFLSKSTSGPNTSQSTTQEQKLAADRDLKRIADIQKIQVALEAYYQANNKIYPDNLNKLREENYLDSVPTDPQSNEPYLYNPLDQPAAYYTVAAVLEVGVGTIKRGLQVFSNDNRASADTVAQQEQAVLGTKTQEPTPDLQVTDLFKKIYLPREEVVVGLLVQGGYEIESAVLTFNGMKLTDKKAPFEFQFSAPQDEGIYEIKIFAFDHAGGIHYQTTKLTVKK